MATIAAILIGIGVLIGSVMATFGFQKQQIPKGLAVLHGIAVGSGMILLLIYALTTSSHHKHWDSLIIFGITAVVGIYLLIKDLKKRCFKTWVLILHALLGLGGIAWITIHLLE